MIFQGGTDFLSPPPPPPSVFRPWHASERGYLSEMFLSACGDHRTQSRTRLLILVCLFAPDQARRTICLQTLIAGRKIRERERERERLHGVCTRMFGSVNQSSDEDPKPKLIARIGFCTATVLTLCILSIACTHF